MTRPITIIAAELGAMLVATPAAFELLRELLSSMDCHVTRHVTSADESVDSALAARRASDRARQKAKRDQAKAAKQTMGSVSVDVQQPSRDASRDKGHSACDLSSSLPLSEPQRSKKVVVERVRATRLSKDTPLTTVNRYFAAAAGIPEAEVDRVWAEFIDYWISVPGQRGMKLNWDATWRNRVRQITPWKGAVNGFVPRPGSREDQRERTANAYQKLSDYADAESHDKGRGSSTRQADAGFLPLAHATRS